MADVDDKPSVRDTINRFMDKLFGNTDDIITTDSKSGFKLRGEDADLCLVRYRHKADTYSGKRNRARVPTYASLPRHRSGK